ncbi:MAG: transglycosylase SLT domain-containing protein [Desulfurivibrionaceae bacterium]
MAQTRKPYSYREKTRTAGRFLAVLVWALLLAPDGAQATIYTFVDRNGTVHFTNVPNDPRYKPGVIRPQFRGASRANRAGDPRLYEEHIRRAASRYEMDPLLIKAVIKTESNFDCQAVSSKGAKGLMQLMPDTAADLNVWNPFDPQENIFGGTNYLRQMMARFGGNLRLALAAYNAGPGRVEAAQGIPMIPETQQYVAKVIQHYRQMTAAAGPSYRWLGASN